MKHALGAAATALAITLAGCATPASTSGQPAAAAECLTVSTDRAATVLGESSGMVPDKAAAVKSTEHENAYYLAIRFSGSGVDKQVGVWATNGLESGRAYSVDGFAEQFSGLPKMDGFSVTDAGAVAAKSCV